MVPDGWTASNYAPYGTLHLLNFPSIQLQYERDRDVKKIFVLYTFLQSITETGLATFIQQQIPEGESRASLIVLRTIPAFRFSKEKGPLDQVEDGSHDSSLVIFVEFFMSFRLPNSTTLMEDLFGVNGAKVTTDFLDQYSTISGDVHLLRTSVTSALLGTSCLPPDGQSTIASYPSSAVFQVPLEWNDLYKSPGQQLFDEMEQTFQDNSLVYLRDFVQAQMEEPLSLSEEFRFSASLNFEPIC